MSDISASIMRNIMNVSGLAELVSMNLKRFYPRRCLHCGFFYMSSVQQPIRCICGVDVVEMGGFKERH